ncbi:MAG: hypothetical protein HKN68_11815 [Saprospiraceae bacterium]|nr:hypothetical protein [Saprospiraceae bacterium]
MLSGPVFRIDLTGWLIPIGILYFTRSSHPLKGYLWAVLFMMIISVIGGLFTSPLPIVAIIISAPIAAFPEMVPYLIDRFMHRRLSPLLASILFPAVAVSLEYMMSTIFSSIGILASTQTHFVEMIQWASVAGVYGISFIMYWTASTLVGWMLSEEDSPLNYKPWLITILMILLFGAIRINTTSEIKDTVKVAGIAVEEFSIWEAVYQNVYGEEIEINVHNANSPEMGKILAAIPEYLKDPENEKYEQTNLALKDFGDQLLSLSANEADAGSRIIVWSETNLPILQKDESGFILKAQELAVEKEVFLSISMGVFLPYNESGPMYENKAILISPEGKVLDNYEKAKPVPFMDSSLPGDGIIAKVETDYGILTQAICYDADFPPLMAQASGADILLLPANDWLGISPYHGDNSVFRAVENGVSIVRPTGSGQSVIFDPYGRALSRVEAFDKEVRIINAYVPINGCSTIFSFIGNLIVWISMMCTAVLITMVIINYFKSRSS